MSKYSKQFKADFNNEFIPKLREAVKAVPSGVTPYEIALAENLRGWIEQIEEELESRGLEIECGRL